MLTNYSNNRIVSITGLCMFSAISRIVVLQDPRGYLFPLITVEFPASIFVPGKVYTCKIRSSKLYPNMMEIVSYKVHP